MVKLRSRAHQVRDAVSMDCCVELLGLDVNDSGKALCPKHDDTRPSVKVYFDHWW